DQIDILWDTNHRFPADFRVEETERSNATSELSLLGSRSVQVIQMEPEHSHSSEPKIDGVNDSVADAYPLAEP
ncbi:hypothetical protein GUJ93_ZPchr0006g43447, partial [Zizania palustris]